MSRHRRHRSKWRSLYLWHRYVGLTAAVFVLLLAATGILLNHTETLRLADRTAQSAWLLDWYGIHAPQEVAAFRAGGHWISRWGQRLYLDERGVDAPDRPLVGAIRFEDFLVVALHGRVLLLTAEGETVEVLGDTEGVPTGLRRIGRAGDRLVAEGAHGTYTAEADLIGWAPGAPAHVEWATPAPLPAALHTELSQRYRGTGLPLERVVLDLHSGRFLGAGGVYLMDAAAVLMGFLAATGVWMWLRQLLRRRPRG